LFFTTNFGMIRHGVVIEVERQERGSDSTILEETWVDGREAEELLRDAFDELEKERERRVELEAKLRALQENPPPSPPPAEKSKKKSKRRSSKSSSAITPAKEDDASAATTMSPQQYTALQHELEGYRQIINAMTQEKPAIAAAIQANDARRSAVQLGRPMPLQNPTLPLHVIRLLEIMPWEPKAQEYAFGTEEIFEWQVYNVKQQKWCSSFKEMPSIFQTLPILKATTNAVQESQPSVALRQPGRDRSLLMFLAGTMKMGSASLTAPPDNSVLTNAGLNHMVELANGFPLPLDGGTWQWVGAWRVEKRVILFTGDGLDNRPQTLDCDEDGWSYAMDVSDYFEDNPEEHCFERPGMVEDKLTLEKASFLSGNKVVRHMIPIRKVRRRKWTRRRVLVDYPYASEQSKHFLRLLAQNASLTFAANKISDQLVDVKMQLTDTRLKTLQHEEETKTKVAQLKLEMNLKEAAIRKLKQQKLTEKKASDSKDQRPAAKEIATDSETEKTCSREAEDRGENSQKENPQQGNELQKMLSQWMSPHNKVKLGPTNGGMPECSDTDHHASVDDSFQSAVVVPEEDESSVESPEANVNDERHATDVTEDDMESRSRRNSINSTGSQKSFDWKKLGRETIEKLKQGQVAAASAPLLWLSPKEKESLGSQESQSTPRSASPTSDSETSLEQDDVDPKWGHASATPEMVVGA
jgi:hypothetical protein